MGDNGHRKFDASNHPEIAKFQALRLRAMKNYSRQALKELERKPVKVSSNYWQQVVNDYTRHINKLIREANERSLQTQSAQA